MVALKIGDIDSKRMVIRVDKVTPEFALESMDHSWLAPTNIFSSGKDGGGRGAERLSDDETALFRPLQTIDLCRVAR